MYRHVPIVYQKFTPDVTANGRLAFACFATNPGQFLDAYLTIVERRRDDPYTEEDLSAQDAMRLNWLEDRFYADPYTTNVTPYKAWSLYSLPPSVKF